MLITKAIHVTGLADKEMREAIGAVCVHAALVELMVERVIANLEGNPKVVTYAEDLGHRLETLKTLAKKSSLGAEQKQTVVSMCGRIKNLLHDRHRVIHGLWAMDEANNLISIFPRTKVDQPFKPMTKPELRRLKLDLWQEYQALLPFADAAKEVALAWPHKSKKSVRPSPPNA